MTTRICILALIGLPATGKTVLSRWLLNHEQALFNIIHLCYDDHLQYPSGMDRNTITELQYKLQRLKITELLESLVRSLKTTNSIPPEILSQVKVTHRQSNDYLIVCDDNNYYRSMRYKLYRMCRIQGAAYAQIFFVSVLTLSLQRNSKRSDDSRVPAYVVRQMWERMEGPNRRKNAWEEATLVLSAANLSFSNDDIIPFLLNTFEHVLEASAPDWTEEEEQEPNLAHQLDLLLRRRIKQLLSGVTAAGVKQTAANLLNNKRREIVSLFNHNMESGAACTDLEKYAELLDEWNE